ncbi:MAG TPA: hypothetical protein VM901_10050 [Bdellovibrionota bacterium]|jgi:membrane associated rhomboid family serine protease|nr:hypothetical protein [Bdellovibrionota bacterium]
MIPLRSSHTVKRIDPLVFAVLAIWLLARVLAWIFGTEFVIRAALIPADFSLVKVLTSIPMHESLFSTLVSMLYFWVFGPAIFEVFRPWRLLVASFVGTALAMWAFCAIHSLATAPILSSDAFLGFYLGAFMRKDIWGSVDTLVIGPLWVRVFSVPSYVLLFFWFFYLLIGNLLLDPPFSDAPMLYLVPLLGFLLGFAYASLKWSQSSAVE